MFKKSIFYIAAASILTISASSNGLAQPGEQEGVVLQTMNSAGYTYIQIDTGTSQDWVAVPETQVAAGERIRYSEGMVMENFHSKSLDRTFPTIIFSSGVIIDKQTSPAASAKQQPAAPNSFAAAVEREKQIEQQAPAAMMGQVSGGSSGAVVPFTKITVEKAEGENGYTIEELYSQAKNLDGTTVKLRGKVVKFNPNIMGTNWVHLQDGTGNPMNNTHDLVITTSEVVEDDQIVQVEGTLHAQKDFGAGYKYEAIVEEAKILE